jgi:(2R)-3-sulfolactate dehydrogenase (NADP+)
MSTAIPSDDVVLSLPDVAALTRRALLGSGIDPRNEAPITSSVVAAEAEGRRSHGLARLPTYCEHARVGRIDGKARPVLDSPKPGLVRVDAKSGFAHPAIDFGLPALYEAAKSHGIAALAVTNSFHCGVIGHHVERIARERLLALGFVNAPTAVAPVDDSGPLFGTNPVALAVPRAGREPLVLDQSLSVLAAWLTGANLLIDASSFSDDVGGSPRSGQFFVACDIDALAGDAASERLQRLVAAIAGQGGQRRTLSREHTVEASVAISRKLFDAITVYAGPREFSRPQGSVSSGATEDT